MVAVNTLNVLTLFSTKILFVNSFLAGGDFCCLLITFANSLDRDQDKRISVLIWIQTV